MARPGSEGVMTLSIFKIQYKGAREHNQLIITIIKTIINSYIITIVLGKELNIILP
jgi:hypothetical protein